MRSYFLEMFKFDKWGNDRVITTLNHDKIEEKRILNLMAHIIHAQDIWLKRIRGIPIPELNAWKPIDIQDLQAQADRMHEEWTSFIRQYPTDTFTEVIDYKDSNGKPYEQVLKDIVNHVLHHGTHHRAQIAAKLTDSGHTSPPLDFIYYKRMA